MTKKQTPKKKTVTKPVKKNAAIIPVPSMRPGDYRPIIYNTSTPRDYNSEITLWDHFQHVQYSRIAYESMGMVNAAIKQIANRTFSRGWELTYNGPEPDYGEAVCQWFNKSYSNICNSQGFPMTFRKTLELISICLYRDGEVLVVKEFAKYYPQFHCIETHRVGQRSNNETTVKSGWAEGYAIKDGIIKNDSGRVIGFRILGDTPVDDIDISVKNCVMIYDPEYFSQGHGNPKLSSVLCQVFNKKDIEDLLMQVVKIESTHATIIHNDNGEPAQVYSPTSDDAGTISPTANADALRDQVQMESINGVGFVYVRAGTGGKVESFRTDRPHSNTMDFLKEVSKEILLPLGWPYQFLVSPEESNGGGARTVKDIVNSTIKKVGDVIEPYAVMLVKWVLAVGIYNELIPDGKGGTFNKDNVFNSNLNWYDGFSFTRAGYVVTDEGNDRAADINDYKMGIKTLDQIVAKYGMRFEQVQDQSEKELRRLIDIAQRITNDTGVAFDIVFQSLKNQTTNFPYGAAQSWSENKEQTAEITSTQ